jgi:hypothetical protein
MRTFGKAILAALVVVAVLAGGCGEDACPSESPQVEAVASCTAPAGSTVSYELRLCPTCNQTLTGCNADIQEGIIFLNPVVEACGSSASCGAPSCLNRPTCSFQVPNATAGTVYSVQVHDPASNSTKEGTLTVGPPASCTI